MRRPIPIQVAISLNRLLLAAAAGLRIAASHIAVIDVAIQAEVLRNDRNFGRFPLLRWRNPIERRSRSG